MWRLALESRAASSTAASNAFWAPSEPSWATRIFSNILNLCRFLNSEDTHVGHRDQPFVHHFFNHRQQPLNVFLGVDDLDHDRKVVREDVRPVNLRCVAVAFEAAEDRGAGDLQFLAFLDDRLVQRFAVVAIPLGEMQTK